jgi:hypothetical protein
MDIIHLLIYFKAKFYELFLFSFKIINKMHLFLACFMQNHLVPCDFFFPYQHMKIVELGTAFMVQYSDKYE